MRVTIQPKDPCEGRFYLATHLKESTTILVFEREKLSYWIRFINKSVQYYEINKDNYYIIHEIEPPTFFYDI